MLDSLWNGRIFIILGVVAVVIILALVVLRPALQPDPPTVTVTPLASEVPLPTLIPTVAPPGTPPAEQTPEETPPFEATPEETPDPAAEAQSAQSLIAAALEAGEIDYGKSLLYRSYALFGDERLPLNYLGDGIEPQDRSLLIEIMEAHDTLSTEVQTLLRPFIVRPNHPESIFNQPAQSANTPRSQAASATPVIACSNWSSMPSKNGHAFMVWACNDAKATADLTAAVTEMDKLWPRMVGLMCRTNPNPDHPCPLPDTFDGEEVIFRFDDGNTDDRIDIYLVNLETVRRDTPILDKPEISLEGRLGVERSTGALVNKGRSGFFLIKRSLFSSDIAEARSALIHEFFHVLQDSHNWTGLTHVPGCVKSTFWFVEASAKWAQWFFDQQNATAFVHMDWFVQGFQTDDRSLHHTNGILEYESYIWLYFMQQELAKKATNGEPDPTDGEPIAKTWDDLAAANNCNEAFDIVDRQLPFSTYFRRFALRNLNWDFGGSKPISPLYDELDTTNPIESRFPTGRSARNYLPRFESGDPDNPQGHIRLINQSSRSLQASVYSLQAEYFWFDVDRNASQIEFYLGALRGYDVDALLKVNGTWTLREMSHQERVRICWDSPDEAIEEVILVVSNYHRNAPNVAVARNFGIELDNRPCVCNADIMNVRTGWTGNISFSFSGLTDFTELGVVNNWTLSRSANYNVTLTRNFSRLEFWYGEISSGTARITESNSRLEPNGDRTTSSIQGDGPVLTGLRPGLYNPSLLFWAESCTYNIRSDVDLDTDLTITGTMTTRLGSTSYARHQRGGDIANIVLSDIPIPAYGLTVLGSKTVPAYINCVSTNNPQCDNAVHFAGAASSPINTYILGAVTVRWEFSPITLPPESPPVA